MHPWVWVVFWLHQCGVTNLLTLKFCHGGSVAVCGRFGKRNAAASAARGVERQGACVVRASARGRSHLRAETGDFARFPSALSRQRRAHIKPVLFCKQRPRAGPLLNRDGRLSTAPRVLYACGQLRFTCAHQKKISLASLVAQSNFNYDLQWDCIVVQCSRARLFLLIATILVRQYCRIFFSRVY